MNISAEIYYIRKSICYEMQIAQLFFRVLKIITVGLKMDSGNAINNCYMLKKFADFNK